MIAEETLLNLIPLEYDARLYENKIALGKCPLCGHVTSNISKKATAIVFSEDRGVYFHCFYCNNEDKRGAIFRVLHEMDLESVCDEISESFSTTKINDFERFSTVEISSLEKEVIDTLKKIEEGDEAYDFLKSRGLERFSNLFYKQGKNLIYPAVYNGKIFAGRVRKLPQDKDKKVWSLKTTPANNYFNIFRCSDINVNYPIYVFEGVEDALSSGKPNSIALFGLDYSKAIRWFSGYTVVFCLDNDEAGIKAMKQIYEEYPDRFYFIAYDKDFGFKDFNDRIKAGTSFEENSKYIDKHLVRNPINFYFSNS